MAGLESPFSRMLVEGPPELTSKVNFETFRSPPLPFPLPLEPDPDPDPALPPSDPEDDDEEDDPDPDPESLPSDPAFPSSPLLPLFPSLLSLRTRAVLESDRREKVRVPLVPETRWLLAWEYPRARAA